MLAKAVNGQSMNWEVKLNAGGQQQSCMPWPFTISSLLLLVTLQVENTIKQLRLSFPKDGLLPIYISPDSGQPTISKVTFGAMGDRWVLALVMWYDSLLKYSVQLQLGCIYFPFSGSRKCFKLLICKSAYYFLSLFLSSCLPILSWGSLDGFFVLTSFYEYLLKVWIQGNKTEVVKHYRYTILVAPENFLLSVVKSQSTRIWSIYSR